MIFYEISPESRRNLVIFVSDVSTFFLQILSLLLERFTNPDLLNRHKQVLHFRIDLVLCVSFMNLLLIFDDSCRLR